MCAAPSNCGFASFLRQQLLGFVFFGVGLWLRLSPNTRGIFQIEELNSSAFVMGRYMCLSYLWHFSKEIMKIFSLSRVSLSLSCPFFFFFFWISCDCADRSRGSDADCRVVWRLRRLQSENMCSASGETVFPFTQSLPCKVAPQLCLFFCLQPAWHSVYI